MKRSLAIDSLRVVLALMVLCIHAGVPVQTSETVEYLLRGGLFRIAVPLFFIINGYYLPSALKSAEAMRNWSMRLLKLYGFWMLVYLPFYWPEQLGLRAAAVFGSIVVFGYMHLWYVSSLLIAGWILFLLRRRAPGSLVPVAALSFIAAVFLQYGYRYSIVWAPVWCYRGPLLALPMLIIGLRMAQGAGANWSRLWLLLAAVGGLALLMLEVGATYVPGAPASGLDVYASLIVVCPAVFLLVKSLPGSVQHDYLTKLSTIIYFCHPLLMWAAMTYLHTGWGVMRSVATMGLCLLLFVPLYQLSKRVRFIF